MTSVRELATCLNIVESTPGQMSIEQDFFGYLARGDVGPLSLRTQMQLVQGPHIDLNLIRVANENFTFANEQQIDAAVEIMRTIYAAQGVGVGRVLRYYITEAEANQLFIYNSTMLIDAQAEALTIAYTVQNKGIDVFLLLQWDPIPGGTVGLSPVGGTCDKHDDCTMTGSVVSLETGPNTGAVLAHEVGHYLGLSHINGLSAAQIDLNGDGVIDPGVPASIVNNVMCPIESVPTPSFNNLQGASIHLHCFMRPGC